MRSAWSGAPAFVVTSSSKVLFVSSIRAHSSPGQSPSIRDGVPVSPARPRASASRLAGSMVTTTARRPAFAASSASAAAVVVLPTPPEPQHTRMLRCATSSVSDAARVLAHTASGSASTSASRRSASSSSSVGPTWVVNTNGRCSCGSGRRSARRASCSPCSVGAVGAERGGRRERLGLARPQAGPCRLGGGERVGADAGELVVEAVDHHRPEPHADAVLQAERGVDQLVDRRLLGQGHEHHLAALVVGEHLEHVAGLGVDGPDPHGVEEGPGRLQEGDGVAGRRRVEQEEVGLAVARSSCFTLPRMRMSLIPGAAVATTSSAPDETRRL